MNTGNFKTVAFLSFKQPAFIFDLYPHIPIAEDRESSGLPLLLCMFNAGESPATLEEDW
jgi:hypothetical protein